MSENNDSQDGQSPGLKLGRAASAGATALFLSKLASRVASALGGLVLIRLLVSPGIYAFIGIATTVPGLVMLGNVSGVSSALTRHLARYKVEKDSDSIWSSFWSATAVQLLNGALLSLIAYFASDPISVLIGKAPVAPFLKLAAALPVVWVYQLIIKSTLLSLGRARAYAVLQFFNDFLLSLIPIIAVITGFGAYGALAGMVLGSYISLSFGLAFSIWTVLAETQKGRRKITFVPTLKRLVKFGYLLGISNGFGTFSGQVINLTVARFVSLDVYGLYSAASSASAFVAYFTDPVASIIYPVFSRFRGAEDKDIMRSVYKQSIRYSSIIVLPVIIFTIVFARPLVNLLFGFQYDGATIFLMILAAAFLPYALGSDSMVTLLTSQGFTAFVGAVSVLGGALNLIVAVVLVPTVGLVPYLVIEALLFFPTYLLGVRKLRRAINISPPLSSVRPLYLAALLAAIVTAPFALLHISNLERFVAGILLVPLAFFFFGTMLRGIDSSDTKNFRAMFSSQPLISTIVGPIIKVVDRMIRLREGSK